MTLFEEPLTFELQATYAQAALLESVISDAMAQLSPPASQQTAYDIQLAVHEIFVNIVDHAYRQQGGLVWLTVSLSEAGRAVEILLRDNGRSFDLPHISCPDPCHLPEGGFGLYLVSRLMDQMTYTKGANENCWRLLKYVSA